MIRRCLPLPALRQQGVLDLVGDAGAVVGAVGIEHRVVTAGGARRIEQGGEIAPGRDRLERRHAEHLGRPRAPADAVVGDGPLVGDPADRGEDGAGVERRITGAVGGLLRGRHDHPRLPVALRHETCPSERHATARPPDRTGS